MNQTLKMQVEEVLDLFLEARNSDITLLIKLWERYYPDSINFPGGDFKRQDPYVFLRDLYELPREDNVKRIRAKIQNQEGKYLPTEWKIAEQRGINEERWKKYLGYKVDDKSQIRMFT